MKTAFVTGANGQDGSYLCELLLSQGYKVTGLIRPSGDGRTSRLVNCLGHEDFTLSYGDITNPSLAYQVANGHWDEIYLCAAVTQIMQSYYAPILTFETNALATARMLEAIGSISPKTKIYFASTSDMFGTMQEGTRANEEYPLAAQSPYAVAKIASHLLCRVYRRKGLFISSGIQFNHESCRRGADFLTRKVGLQIRETGKVTLGNLDAMRDWHHAKDMARGMWLSLQADEPNEYVFSSGVSRSINELVQSVCDYFNIPNKDVVSLVECEKRPWDVKYLCGDSSKAKDVLGWVPEISWEALIEDVCKPRGTN